jgi:hypothetical protein
VIIKSKKLSFKSVKVREAVLDTTHLPGFIYEKESGEVLFLFTQLSLVSNKNFTAYV